MKKETDVIGVCYDIGQDKSPLSIIFDEGHLLWYLTR